MNDEFQEIKDAIRKWQNTKVFSNIVSLNIFVNSQEIEFKFSEKTPDNLDKHGISMRNLAGEWIK